MIEQLQEVERADERDSGANQWLRKASLGPTRSSSQYRPIPPYSLYLHHILLFCGGGHQTLHVSMIVRVNKCNTSG